MEAPRRDGASTRTLTAVIADRVKTLRGEARLSGPALAAAMNERGIPWNRTTVAKLETGRRETVTVQELLALALVLNVPPVWLLADPEGGSAVAVAEGVEADPWTALLWLTGWQPLEESGAGAWASANNAIRLLHALGSELMTWRSMRRATDVALVPAMIDQQDVPVGELPVWGDLEEARRQLDAPETAQLRAIADRLRQFRELQLPVPQMPANVGKRAAELGVELPGQDVTP